MRRTYLHTLAGCFLLVLVTNSSAFAQFEATFTEFQWIGGTGSQSWQNGGNWDLPDFPNDTDPLDMDYPTANLSVSLGANLNVGLGTSPVTIAGLTLGGISSAVTTEVSSGGPAGTLNFKNYFVPEGLVTERDADFDNDGLVAGSDFLIWQRNYLFQNSGPDNINDQGDANRDDIVDGTDLQIWQDQYGLGNSFFTQGDAFLRSAGVAGSVNRITAPIHLEDEPLEIDAINPLLIDVGGNITNSAPDLTSSSRISVVRGTVTINSEVIVTNVDTTPDSGGTDMTLRANGDGAALILNGIVRDANPAEPGNVTFGGGDGRIEIYGNNDLGGTVRTGGDEIILGHDHALGVSSVAPFTPAHVRPGGTFYSDNNLRNIPNKITLQSNFNVAGDKTLTLSGEVTQTNNRGFNNNITAPGMLILDGLLNIWEDDEALVREFDFLGTGTTLITGVIRDDQFFSGQDRRINQIGPGVLIIDVGPGDNSHSGPTTISRGNLHYANNDSLNVGGGMIVSRGGAIGVDTGVATNTTFLQQIDPISTGGLMLTASDAAANLDFTSFPLSNAGNMTVAAPETGLTYTGTITPANSTYGLGGGSGTLTLPNAQLTGANSLQVRNEGVVELLGDNTYTGPTSILKKPSSSDAPTLVVDDLANGGAASSIGSATSDPANLFIQGSTLKYVGTGDSTDRLFTIGTAGATINSSGTGAMVFSNTGMLGRDDAESRLGTLDDFSGRPDEIVDVADTSDIVAGMPVSDPSPGGVFTQPPCNPDGSHCIPVGTVVTGVSTDGSTIGISNFFPFIFKPNTTIVFGTVPRTLTLDGTNANDNTLASVISDSPAGGIVNVTKSGTGKWVLTGSNTYTGDTTVEEGILSMNNAFLADSSAVRITGGVLDLNFGGSDIVGSLFLNGTQQANGTWGRIGHPTAMFTSAFFTGNGLLNVGGVPLGALASVPEPGAFLLTSFFILGFAGNRMRTCLF